MRSESLAWLASHKLFVTRHHSNCNLPRKDRSAFLFGPRLFADYGEPKLYSTPDATPTPYPIFDAFHDRQSSERSTTSCGHTQNMCVHSHKLAATHRTPAMVIIAVNMSGADWHEIPEASQPCGYVICIPQKTPGRLVTSRPAVLQRVNTRRLCRAR